MTRLNSRLEQVVTKIWRKVMQPGALGGLLGASALVTLLAPLSELPSQVPQSWWSTPFHFPEVLRASATLMGVAAVIWLGIELSQGRLAKGRERLIFAGRMLTGLGLILSVGIWLAGQTTLPTSTVVLPVGGTTETIQAREVRGSVRAMLPFRLKVTSLDRSQQLASIQISKVNEPGNIYDVRAGMPVDIQGYRIALLGVNYDERVLQAVLDSSQENTIPAVGGPGAKVRFALNGPEYEVMQIIRNYLQAMGPAVELKHEDGTRFWVYQRSGTESYQGVDGIGLLNLETAPLAVLAVTRQIPMEWLGASGILFVLGLGLLVGVRREEEQ